MGLRRILAEEGLRIGVRRPMPKAQMAVTLRGRGPQYQLQLGGVYGDGAEEIEEAVGIFHGSHTVEEANTLLGKLEQKLRRDSRFRVSLATDVLDLPMLSITWAA